MPNSEEIAWAAGLFEGEGCMAVYQTKYGAKIQPQVRLAMKDADVVERFATIVGCGHLRSVPAKGNCSPMREWYVYEAVKVREVIGLLLPFFGDRRRAKALEVLDRSRYVREHSGKRTHCPQGHAYEGENVAMESGKRRCRICRNTQTRDRARQRLGITPDRFRVKEQI